MSLDWFDDPPPKELSVEDLPDLLPWRMPDLISLERAALLWGGIVNVIYFSYKAAMPQTVWVIRQGEPTPYEK